MAYFEWSESLSVGIDEIDRQHKRIIDYINLLDQAIQQKSEDKIKDVIHGLIDYTDTHFAFEEDLMRKMEYALVDTHSITHRSFISRIKDYQNRFNNGEDISRKLLTDLRIWLTNHIKKDDQDYAPKLQKLDHRGWWDKALHKLLK